MERPIIVWLMEKIPSFAPLAARLAVLADKIRPVDGARDDWAKVVALVWCAVLQMLILLCEALDTRAAADARLMAVAAPRDGEARFVLGARSGCPALPGARRPTRLTLVPQVQAMAPERDDVPAAAAEPTFGNPRLAWALHAGPNRAVSPIPWRPRRETSGLLPGFMHA